MGSMTRKEGCAVGFGNIIQSGDAHLFAASPIFQDADVEFLHQLSSRMSTKKFEEGKTIIQEGEEFRPEQDYVYWIAKGQVEVWKGGNFVNLLGEGDVFGELAAFANDNRPSRQATIKSKTKVVLRVVKGGALIDLLKQHEDEELIAKWEADQDRRMNQLLRKDELTKQMRHKPLHLDFMFMKLQSINDDGVRMPKNEPLDLGMYAHRLEKDAALNKEKAGLGKVNLDHITRGPVK